MSEWSLIFSSMFLFRYENPLSPLGQHISTELGLTKRHFFQIPSPHCNLDEYEYEDDFEWSWSVFSPAECRALQETAQPAVDESHQDRFTGSGQTSINRKWTEHWWGQMCWGKWTQYHTFGQEIWSEQMVVAQITECFKYVHQPRLQKSSQLTLWCNKRHV